MAMFRQLPQGVYFREQRNNCAFSKLKMVKQLNSRNNDGD